MATDTSSLARMAEELYAVGFLIFTTSDGIEIGTFPGPSELFDGAFNVTDHWQKVCKALDVRLSDLAALKHGLGCVVQPLFGACERKVDNSGVYVIMPFADSFRPVYEKHIRPVVQGMGLKCMRGDEQLSTRAVMDDIWRGLTTSRVVIADCTGKNSNVFYEIGIAHTLGKPTVLLAQHSNDVPFDVRHIRFLEYQPTPEGLTDLDDRLRNTLWSELNE